MSVKRHAICGSIEQKVRHIYDVVRLYHLPEIKEFLNNRTESPAIAKKIKNPTNIPANESIAKAILKFIFIKAKTIPTKKPTKFISFGIMHPLISANIHIINNNVKNAYIKNCVVPLWDDS